MTKFNLTQQNAKYLSICEDNLGIVGYIIRNFEGMDYYYLYEKFVGGFRRNGRLIEMLPLTYKEHPFNEILHYFNNFLFLYSNLSPKRYNRLIKSVASKLKQYEELVELA